MKRDPVLLNAAASRVQDDLRRTTDRVWTCVVGSDLVLSVTDGQRGDSVLLDADVEDPSWFISDGATETEIRDGLDAEADELVAGEVAEVLRVLGIARPTCRDPPGRWARVAAGGTATGHRPTTSP